jgi:hypothetical protein
LPLPLLWRQAELTVALNRTAARAIVTTGRVDGVVYADLAMNAAAEAFSIRHVCGFGDDLPEGMASLDHAILRESSTSRPVIQDGRKAALISFDVTNDGFRPVPRAHLALIAAGLAISLESGVAQGATISAGGQLFTISYTGGASSRDVVLTRVAPTFVYVDSAWTGFTSGTVIADADPVTAGAQPATIGVKAFASVNAAIAACPDFGAVVVNGQYAGGGLQLDVDLARRVRRQRSGFPAPGRQRQRPQTPVEPYRRKPFS